MSCAPNWFRLNAQNLATFFPPSFFVRKLIHRWHIFPPHSISRIGFPVCWMSSVIEGRRRSALSVIGIVYSVIFWPVFVRAAAMWPGRSMALTSRSKIIPPILCQRGLKWISARVNWYVTKWSKGRYQPKPERILKRKGETAVDAGEFS